MNSQTMNSIRDRAARLLCAAFGVNALDQIEIMLNSACDQTPKKLVDHLSAVLLNEGLWVAVDRARIAEIVEQETNLEPGDDEIDSFIADNYESEIGYPRDALEDGVRALVNEMDWSTSVKAADEPDCFNDGREAEADADHSRFDDDPSPYAGAYSEE